MDKIVTKLRPVKTALKYRPNLFNRVYILIFLVALLSFFPVSQSMASRTLLGNIEKIVGDVRISKGWKKMQPAKEGQKLYSGDKIKTLTNSRLYIRFKDGADFKLGEKSSLRLKRSILNKGKKKQPTNNTELLSGTLWASVDPLKKKAVFVVESPTAGVSIRGTELMAVVDKNVSTFFLKSGTIKVTGGDSQHILTPGEMTANIGKRRLITPIAIKGRKGLQEVEQRILAATSMDSATSLKKRQNYGEILARFYINYSSYLVDSGSYYDAITMLLMAQSISKNSDKHAEISSLIANVNARFLKAYDEAAYHYQSILDNYPHSPYYEVTLFHYALLLQAQGDLEGANRLFNRYIKEYPNGKLAKTIKYNFLKKQ
ncbi:MAG: FecR domain-containing protein [Magnetococcales bacterium]|nr:FecR domain-containing protein [Magnetococcales bacterium]